MKNKLIKKFKCYKEIIIIKCNLSKNKIKKIILIYLNILKKDFINIKKSLLCSKNHKRNLIIITSLIVFNLFLLLAASNAYYQSISGISLMHALVGDFTIEGYDYTLKIFLENVGNSGTYHVSEILPNTGYIYKNSTCKNNGTLTYDSTNNTTSIEFTNNEHCSIYFDLDTDLDIHIYLYIEDDVNSNSFHKVNNIPAYGYTYNNYTCENDSTLNYDSALHKITTNSIGKDVCEVYFTKSDADIIANIYIETAFNSNTYQKENYILNNKTYSLNETKSKCTDTENNNVNASISYTNGYINIDTPSNAICEIYLDDENE